MSKALSADLRSRVVAAVKAGASHREAAARFGVSAASVSRWRRLDREQGDVRPGRCCQTKADQSQKSGCTALCSQELTPLGERFVAKRLEARSAFD
jgi:transposase